MLRGNNVNINFSASEPYFDIVDERTPIEVEVKLATEFRGPPQYKVIKGINVYIKLIVCLCIIMNMINLTINVTGLPHDESRPRPLPHHKQRDIRE